MQLETQKYLNRLDDIAAFLDARAAFLATWPRIAALKTQMQAKRAEIVQFSQQQTATGGTSSRQVQLKQTLIDALFNDLEDMARTAKVMELETPGLAAGFQLPASKGEQAIVGAARVFKQNGTPAGIRDEFIAMGMPADFLTDLTTDIAAYDGFASAKSSAQQASSDALKALETALRAAGQIVDTFDAIIRNIYRSDKAQLAAWQEAKRLRDIRAHRKPATPPTP